MTDTSHQHPAKVARTDAHGDTTPGTASGLSTVDVTALTNSLQCSLCLSLICEPISIACGHSFCRVCLVESLRRHKKQCPSCRAICHVSAETAQENVMIKSMAMTLDPDGYMTRLEEARSLRDTWSALYPIFFYNSVMFPGSVLSLHLFEPRYRHMMSRIVNTTQAFAYVPNFVNYHAANGDIALVARLKDVSFLPDGRCFLEAVLASRCTIVDNFVEDGTMGLHFCRVQPLHDQTVTAEDIPLVAQLQRQGRILADYVSDQIGSKAMVEQRFGAPPSDPEGYSLWLTALAPLPESEKLQLLRGLDTKARLERCVLALGAFVSRRNNPNSFVNTTRSTVASALRGVMQVLMRNTSQSGNNHENEENNGEDYNVEEEGDENEDNEDNSHEHSDDSTSSNTSDDNDNNNTEDVEVSNLEDEEEEEERMVERSD